MGRSKLLFDYEFNFDCYGIISLVKGYKLAWRLNAAFGVNLVKSDDLVIEFLDGNKIYVTNYLYETEHKSIRLIKNKSEEFTSFEYVYLVPELQNFDYLLLIRNDNFDEDEFDVLDKLKSIEEIHFQKKFDIESLKSKENLIF